MPQSFFIWNGTDCRSKGIYLSGPAAIIRPEERVNHIQIPGRSGDLTELEGENVYNSYIQTVSIHVKSAHRVKEVYDWLRGSGYVTFSGETNRRQKARIIGAITLDKASRNLDIWVGEVQFYCQPLKEKIIDPPDDVLTSVTLKNTGDVTAYPLWRIQANNSTVVLTVNGESLTLTNVTAGHWYKIDSQNMTVINDAGTNCITKKSSGVFPVLTVGDNTVAGSGWTKIEVTKRERFL